MHPHIHREGGRGEYNINEETHYQIYEGWSQQAPSFCCYETSSERMPDGGRLREGEEGWREDEKEMRDCVIKR